MASGTKALVAILVLCVGSGLIGYNLAPQPARPDKPMVPKPVRTSVERSSELKHESVGDNGSHVAEGSKSKPSLPEKRATEADKANELELRPLGNRKINEGVTRERYVLHSFLQLTNVSNRTIKIEEWWVNRRQGAPLCSKTTEMENAALGEAAKLKQETGRDISALFGQQLRPLRPGEFITLDINNEYCGSIFRVDVRTDRQTEFWTAN